MKLRVLYQNTFILPVITAITYVALILEAVKYPGFVGNHFFVDAKVYFALTLLFLILSTQKSRLLTLTLTINKFLFAASALIYLFLLGQEGAHYTNYVLATFRIHLDGLILVVLFSASLLIAGKLRDMFLKSVPKLGLIYPAILFSLILFAVQNINSAANFAFNADSYIIFHPASSYDEKMYYQWGDFYRFMVFVRENTPETATIVVPPEQDPWLIGSGNPNFVRAFIYPRKIVSETIMIKKVNLYPPGTFILISWGKEACKPDPDCHGWPRQKIKADKIIYKDPNSTGVIEIRENVIYTPEDKRYVYGLIKL